jgi:hypothetical protein
MFLEPGVSEDRALLAKLRDGKQGSLGMVIVSEDDICDLANHASLVRGSIDVIDRNWAKEFSCRNVICTNIFCVHEKSFGATIDQRRSAAFHAGVGCLEFYVDG